MIFLILVIWLITYSKLDVNDSFFEKTVSIKSYDKSIEQFFQHCTKNEVFH